MPWRKDNHEVYVRNKNGSLTLKKIYYHSVTGELRVQKYINVAGKDGRKIRKAIYVKTKGLGRGLRFPMT